jgi:hypothetical protein
MIYFFTQDFCIAFSLSSFSVSLTKATVSEEISFKNQYILEVNSLTVLHSGQDLKSKLPYK